MSIDVKSAKEGLLNDIEGCEDAKLHSNPAVLPTSHGGSTEKESVDTTLQEMENFAEEERDGTKMKDKESVEYNGNTMSLLELDLSKKAVVTDSGGNGFGEEQLGIIEEKPREALHNTSNNEVKDEIINMNIDRLTVDINLTKDKSIDLVHDDSKEQRKVTSHNVIASADPPESALARDNPVIGEDKTSTEALSHLLVSHLSAREHDVATIHSQSNKICNISDVGSSQISDNGKDMMTESKKKNDGIANSANVQSLLDYDADAMMTDSQINLLDEDILTLPQRYYSVIQSVRVNNYDPREIFSRRKCLRPCLKQTNFLGKTSPSTLLTEVLNKRFSHSYATI